MIPVNTGSSEKHSKFLPPLGFRCKLIVGPINNCVLFNSVSFPISRPTSSISAGSNVEARHDALGKTADDGPSCDCSPRHPRSSAREFQEDEEGSPEGPSDVLIEGIFRRATSAVSQKLLPERRKTFSSTVRASITVWLGKREALAKAAERVDSTGVGEVAIGAMLIGVEGGREKRLDMTDCPLPR